MDQIYSGYCSDGAVSKILILEKKLKSLLKESYIEAIFIKQEAVAK